MASELQQAASPGRSVHTCTSDPECPRCREHRLKPVALKCEPSTVPVRQYECEQCRNAVAVFC